MKFFLKKILSYIFNGAKLLRMGHVGKGVFILKGLTVNSPQYIEIGDRVRIGRFSRLSCYDAGKTILLKIGNGCYIGDFSLHCRQGLNRRKYPHCKLRDNRCRKPRS